MKAVDVSSALAEDTQWKKEKGLVVLQPKKKKEEEESEKKQKKQRKPKEEVFSIPFNIQALF